MILRVIFMDHTWSKGVESEVVWSIFTYELVCLSLLGSNTSWAGHAREHLQLLWYKMFSLFQQMSLSQISLIGSWQTVRAIFCSIL